MIDEVYEARDALLLGLGYLSYSHYLGGELWKSIRKVVLEANPKCFCGRIAAQVHHRNYARATMLGEDLSALLAVCGRCHCKIERSSNKGKLSFAESEQRCQAMLAGEKPKKKKCAGCGAKPRKGADFCRICIRVRRYGVARFPSRPLPRCEGKDCVHQAGAGNKYCRIHLADPELSLRDHYIRNRKLARKRQA